MAEPKRRLPVLNSGSTSDEPERPPWHWVGFGTAAIFTAWLPLGYMGVAVVRRLLARFADASAPEDIAGAVRAAPGGEVVRLEIAVWLLLALPLVLAAFAGGYLVGRWGKGAGVREAALSGLATALVACALSWAEAGLSWAPLAGIVLAVPMAAWGGRTGLRASRPAGLGR